MLFYDRALTSGKIQLLHVRYLVVELRPKLRIVHVPVIASTVLLALVCPVPAFPESIILYLRIDLVPFLDPSAAVVRATHHAGQLALAAQSQVKIAYSRAHCAIVCGIANDIIQPQLFYPVIGFPVALALHTCFFFLVTLEAAGRLFAPQHHLASIAHVIVIPCIH